MAVRFAPLTADDPREVGGYTLRARLGVGGMGRVYLSFTPGGRALAVKVIRPEHAEDEEFRRRFQREVSAAQLVQGIYTAPVVDADAQAPLPWLATAYVPGPSLRQAVTEHGPLPLPTVFRLLAGVAEGLAAVHACGLIHRDLTPANVLLADDGPRVIDFGIAHAAATSLTRTGVSVGTPAFMAPEQVCGRSDTPATDVFALGHLAVFAATGHTAFGEGNHDALLYRIINEPPRLDGCPHELRAIAIRCLAKDPSQRPSLTEIMEYAREQTQGQALRQAAGSWLPAAIATSLATYIPAKIKIDPDDQPLSTKIRDQVKADRKAKVTAEGRSFARSIAAIVVGVAFLVIGPKMLDTIFGFFSHSSSLADTDAPRYTTPTRTTVRHSDPTTVPTTPRFDPDSLNYEATDRTPQSPSALLPISFTDSAGQHFTFEARGPSSSCLSPDQTSYVQDVLTRHHCLIATTGAIVSEDNTILVSVKVMAFVDSSTAMSARDALQDTYSGDLGIICPATGPASRVCTGSSQVVKYGWTGQRYRYLVNTVATYTYPRQNPDTDALLTAAKKALDSAGPQNYVGNR